MWNPPDMQRSCMHLRGRRSLYFGRSKMRKLDHRSPVRCRFRRVLLPGQLYELYRWGLLRGHLLHQFLFCRPGLLCDEQEPFDLHPREQWMLLPVHVELLIWTGVRALRNCRLFGSQLG